MNSNK